MAEAVWNGFLRLSLVSFPVRLAPATSEAHLIRLDPLNSRTGNPLAEQLVDSETGDVVSRDAAALGYKTAGSGYLTIADSELDAIAGAPSNLIEVAHFSAQGQIDRARLGASYYIYPDGQLAADALDALRLALRRSGRELIGYVRLGERAGERAGGRESMVLIQPLGGVMVLSILRALQGLEPAEFAERAESDIPAEMVDIADALIGRFIPEADANTLHDRYEERLRALIAHKSGGNATLPPWPAATAASIVPAPAPPPVATRARRRRPARTKVAPPSPPEPEPPAAMQVASAPAMPEAATIWADAQQREFEAPPSEEPWRALVTEILLHITGLGDLRFVEPGWAGHPGSRRQIEAISIRPPEEMEPSAIEFRVFAQEDRATAWITSGNYAGTTGRELPLTGFAVRPAPELGDRFDIEYEGCFFDGGVVGPKRNGEICTSPIPNDPLEAVRVSIVERQSDLAL